MKKILLFLVCSFFCRCDCPDAGVPPYDVTLSIGLGKIKDPRVKSIKVSLKNLDGIKPEFNYKSITEQKRSKSAIVITSLEPHKGTYSYYFKGINVSFGPPSVEERYVVGKKRTYELKMYINDKWFFTKKISFIPKKFESRCENYVYSDKVEVDNMDFVKEISSAFRPSWNWLIEITDADVKKFLILEKSR